MAETKKLSIIAFSGDFDKLTAVFPDFVDFCQLKFCILIIN